MALSSKWKGSWPLKPEIVSSNLRRVTKPSFGGNWSRLCVERKNSIGQIAWGPWHNQAGSRKPHSSVRVIVANITCSSVMGQNTKLGPRPLSWINTEPTQCWAIRLLDNRIDNVGIIYLLSCQANLALRSNEDTTIPVRRQKFRI